MIHPTLQEMAVPVADLELYPGNARVGDVSAIRASLKRNGQYRPIVVQRSTRRVLAGNHTLKAARELGWTEIAASFVDVDDTTAARIVLVDNRSSDMAMYDDPTLLRLMEVADNLDGTGWSQPDFDRITARVEADGLFDDKLEKLPSGKDRQLGRFAEQPGITFDRYSFHVDRDDFTTWADALVVQFGHDGIADEIRRRLMLPPGIVAPAPPRPGRKQAGGGARPQQASPTAQLVDVDELRQFADNPRLGVVERIAESLKANGQYRPIVVNSNTGEVLCGNHTLIAAKQLGWPAVAVVWVDVDEQEAAAIVLADNRTADLGTYATDALAELLESVGGAYGTGWTAQEWERTLADAGRIDRQMQGEPARHFRIVYGAGNIAWRISSTATPWDAWLEALIREARYSDEGVQEIVVARLELS